MMDGNPNDPLKESWGGSFEKMSYSPRVIFDRLVTTQDTVPIYSIIEFRVKGPQSNISPDSVCITLNIGKQNWGGYYLGNGIYAIRYSTYKLGTFPYTIISDIAGFEKQEGAITIGKEWLGKMHDTDYLLGNT